MRPVTTIILLLVAAATLVGIALFERRLPTTRQTQESGKFVLQLDPGRISGVEITNAAGHFFLVRQDHIWKIKQPFEDRADGASVGEVLKLATEAEVLERIPSEEVRNSGALKEYGLDPGNHVQVVFHLGDGGRVVVMVGKATAYEDSAYLRLQGSNDDKAEVLVARTKARPVVSRAVGEFRDPKLLQSTAEQIVKIAVRTAASEVEMVRDPPNRQEPKSSQASLWRLTRPLEERADQEIMDRLLAGLASAKAESFSESVAAQPASEPVVRVAVWAADGNATGETLEIFEGADAESTLVRSSLRPVTARASKDLLALRLCDFGQLRDTRLAALDPRRITTVQVRDDHAGTTALHRHSDRWYVVQDSVVHDANHERIEKVFQTLNNALIVQAHDEPGDLSQFGLDNPFLEITFGTPDHADRTRPSPLTAANSATLRLGEMNNRFFGQWTGRPSVYRIDGAIPSQIPREWVYYKNLRVLSFAPLTLKKLTLTQPPAPPLQVQFDLAQGATWNALRDGTDLTVLLDKQRLERLVQRLSELSAHDWVADGAQAIEALKDPALVIRIEIERFAASGTGTTSVSHTLSFAPLRARQNTALYYARTDETGVIFTVQRGLFEELSAPILARRAETSSSEQ
ncbi:MAG: DUF4340 domain-containing protein [Verrucomicrobiales bacterium]